MLLKKISQLESQTDELDDKLSSFTTELEEASKRSDINERFYKDDYM